MSETSEIALLAGGCPDVPKTPPAAPPHDTVHHPTSDKIAVVGSETQETPDYTPERFWYELINERAAAEFLGLTDRTLQTFRYRGDGALYVAVSSRCIRYRRIDLKAWADERLRSSTADTGPDEAA